MLRHSDGPRYAQTLLKLSHAVPAVTIPVGACGSLDSGTTLEARITRLLDDRRKPMTRMNGWMRVVTAIGFLTMMTVIAATRIVQADPVDSAPPINEATESSGIAPSRPFGAISRDEELMATLFAVHRADLTEEQSQALADTVKQDTMRQLAAMPKEERLATAQELLNKIERITAGLD
ncbi:MAG: hypothetical protein IIC89_08215, partial [Chloroflexi bacterium]|nr:hypothetical protein [Chloroflexota bacterium]